MSNVNPTQQQQMNLQIKYDDLSVRYANQALCNTTAEECYIEFSSGIITDRANNTSVMPIHTRIVMTPMGMLRLYQLLGQALQNYRVVQTAPAPQPEAPQPVEVPASEEPKS